MKNLFVTGTGTGVGKTVLAASLLRLARDRGIDAVPMKPVQTGCVPRDNTLDPPDLAFMLEAAAIKPEPGEPPHMCPYRFEPACSPHLAASAGQPIELSAILDAYRQLQSMHDAVVVEGAGGIFVPLNHTETMLDMMRALALPVVLAAQPGLGTLNHTFLSLHVLRTAGLDLRAIVLVSTTDHAWTDIEQDNLETIEAWTRLPVLHLPYMPRAQLEAEKLTPLALLLED